MKYVPKLRDVDDYDLRMSFFKAAVSIFLSALSASALSVAIIKSL